MDSEPDDSTRFSRRPNVASANCGAEVVLLDLPRGAYVGLNVTAAHIWSLLAEPRTLEGLCDAMMLEFEVDADRCRNEISALLKKFLAAGLVLRDDATPA